MRLKTAPRVIIGLAVLGVAIYFGNQYMDKRKATAPAVDAAVIVQDSPAQVQPTAQPDPVQAQPAPTQPAPQPQRPASRQDRAMQDLLKETK